MTTVWWVAIGWALSFAGIGSATGASVSTLANAGIADPSVPSIVGLVTIEGGFGFDVSCGRTAALDAEAACGSVVGLGTEDL